MTLSSTDINAFSSAQQLLAALNSRRVSARELLDLHLSRIQRYNPTLNAIVIPTFDRARQEAAEADAARERCEARGALSGLPLTIKDCIEVAGLPATAGIPERAQLLCEASGPVGARVLAAGAVLLGKTNVPPYAGDWQSNNPIFGCSNNPWDLARTPGGSTGGGAAAVAAGLSALEFGSDIGGSIRVPASFCGIYGHRPSETAVPRSGHVPGSPRPNPAFVMGVQGPLARSADDLELALDVITGPDIGEDAGWRLQLAPPRQDTLPAFRVAVLPAPDWLPVDAEIQAALDGVAVRLSRLGAKVKTAQPRGFDLREHHGVYIALLTLMLFADLDAGAREGVTASLNRSDDEFRGQQLRGLNATAGEFMAMLHRRERYREAYRAFFRDYDILLSPVAITPAFEHIAPEVSFPERTLTINGKTVPYERMSVYAGVATLSGQPATAFPAGRSRAGLPLGLQAIGPYLEDRTPIRFAALLAREFGGYSPPPGYEKE